MVRIRMSATRKGTTVAIEATYTDDLYTFTGGPAHAELTRFSGKTDTITCEVRIVWRQDPVRTVHGPARWNLLADRTLSGIARACAEQTAWDQDVWVRARFRDRMAK